MGTTVKTEEKIQVVVSNDQVQFMKEIEKFCKDKKVLSKHYSAQTQFMQTQAIAGIQQPGVQPIVLLHCIILYEEKLKLVE